MRHPRLAESPSPIRPLRSLAPAGLHPRSHGVVGEWNDDGSGRSNRGSGQLFLAEAHQTLAEAALRSGITTFGASANPIVSRGTNFTQGFETFHEFGFDAARLDWTHGDDVLAPFADWLTANRGLRFFAYLHVMEPHDPYTPKAAPSPPLEARPEVRAGRAHQIGAQLRNGRTPPLTPAELAHLHALYTGEVGAFDEAFGRLLATIQRAGIRETTTVILLADHGESFLEHGDLVHRHHLTDELIHVPFVIVGPGIAPGRIATQVEHIDVYPTIAALLGLTGLSPLPGQSVLGDTTARPVFSETEYGRGPTAQATELVALREPPWKLIWAPASQQYELFDLPSDPGEHVNRFGDNPEAAALATRLADWRRTAPLPPVAVGSDPTLRDKLRALGYAD